MKKLFSRIDLEKAYLQIPVSPENIPKTAVTTPLCFFESVRMLLGLNCASSTFQWYRETIFANVANVDPYIDDLRVASETEEQQMFDLDQVFQVISDNSSKNSVIKCEFFKDSLNFLGFQINVDCVRPPEDKSESF